MRHPPRRMGYGQCMSGFGPLRSNVCRATGAPQSGHARSARSASVGGGVVSYGPTAAGPASRMSFVLSHAYQPPASRTRARSGRGPGVEASVSDMIISVLMISASRIVRVTVPGPDDLLKLDNQVCFALVTAARNVVSIYRPILEPLGLTHPQYLVMLALWESSPRSLRELADELALEPATLSPLVKRLEAQRLVTRRRRDGDERVLDIGLTAEGRALRARALDVPVRVMERVGGDAASLVALRDALAPFAGRQWAR